MTLRKVEWCSMFDLKPYNVKSGFSQPHQACWPPGSHVNKRSSALHASVAADICLTSRLVRVTSCALS